MSNVRMNVVFSSSQNLLPGSKFERCTLHGLSCFLALAYLTLPFNESRLSKTWLSPLYLFTCTCR